MGRVSRADLIALQADLGLSDSAMAEAIGVDRTTLVRWKNSTWHSGQYNQPPADGELPEFVALALSWMLAIIETDPDNHALPEAIRDALRARKPLQT